MQKGIPSGYSRAVFFVGNEEIPCYTPIFDSIKAKNPRRCEVLRFFLMPKNVAIYYYFFRVCRITFFMLKSVRIS